MDNLPEVMHRKQVLGLGITPKELLKLEDAGVLSRRKLYAGHHGVYLKADVQKALRGIVENKDETK